jgi:hypothetical protein
MKRKRETEKKMKRRKTDSEKEEGGIHRDYQMEMCALMSVNEIIF